jgi:hypothetical protein
VIADLLSTYSFWLAIILFSTIHRGSQGCRTWIIFAGIVLMVVEICLKLTETNIPEWFPRNVTEYELVFYLHSQFPVFICLLRVWAESSFIDLNTVTTKVLLEVIQHQKVSNRDHLLFLAVSLLNLVVLLLVF